MIWQLNQVDAPLLDAFAQAGQPDQAAIDKFLARTGKKQKPMAEPEEPRYYYLMKDDPRVRITFVGQRLETWPSDEPLMVVVGTVAIIGEFAGNRHLAGKLGLNLKMQPLAWLEHGNPDLVLADGQAFLDEISSQVLDRQAIEQAERKPGRKVGRWKI